MTATTTRERPSVAARRVGYAIAVSVNVILLFLINVRPGWQIVPFLTPDFATVLGLVNLSMAAGAVVNLVYLAVDPPWVVALGSAATTGIGLAAMIRLWQVFPLDLTAGWAFVARLLLVVGIVGSVLGLVVNGVTLARSAVRSGPM